MDQCEVVSRELVIARRYAPTSLNLIKSGHNGRGWTHCLPDPDANDPSLPLKGKICCDAGHVLTQQRGAASRSGIVVFDASDKMSRSERARECLQVSGARCRVMPSVGWPIFDKALHARQIEAAICYRAAGETRDLVLDFWSGRIEADMPIRGLEAAALFVEHRIRQQAAHCPPNERPALPVVVELVFGD